MLFEIGQLLGADRAVWATIETHDGSTLPGVMICDVRNDNEATALIGLWQSELDGQKCEVGSVVNRLGEVLIVQILRDLITSGSAQPGVLAGLSDPRLSRAIVAIHDAPGRAWRYVDLAEIAGLSLSRFGEVFLKVVGAPPAAYLRRWRLMLARQDVLLGDRIDAAASRYGYRSPEGGRPRHTA